jgi:hypothetical protein
MEEFILVVSVSLCLFGFACVGYHTGAYEKREYQKCRQFAGIETCLKYAGLEK